MAQKPRTLTPYASPAHLFGAELRLRRGERSLDALAGLLRGEGYATDRGYLSLVEAGARLPTDRRLAEFCDRVLGAEDALLRLWEFADANRMAARQVSRETRQAVVDLATNAISPVLAGDMVLVPYLTPAGTVEYMKLSRRAFLNSGMAVVAAAGALAPDEVDRLTRALDEPRRADEEVAGYFRRLLAEHKAKDFLVHPGDRLGVVVTQVGVLDRLSRQARRPAASSLRGVQAEYAEYAGWLHQGVGNPRTARYWTDQASAWAQEAGDWQLVTFTSIRRGNIACLFDQPREAINILAAVPEVPWQVPPGLGSLAAEYRATAHSAAGEELYCLAQLEEAERLLTVRDQSGADTIYWVQRRGPESLTFARAESYRNLGRPDLLQNSIRWYEDCCLPATPDKARRLVSLAVTYAVIGEPTMACERAQAAVDHFDLLSYNGRRRLYQLTDELLEPWATERPVAELRERVNAARRSVTS